MNSVFAIVGVLVVLAVSAGTAHFVLIWMERRGGVYYRTKDRPRPSSLGLVEEIYQPSVEHGTEATTGDRSRADQAESGDGEGPGSAIDP